jgi:TonB family protein
MPWLALVALATAGRVVVDVQPAHTPREPPRLAAPLPEYPPVAAQRGEEGDVALECVVNADGVPTVRALSSREPFTDAALKAVAQWRYASERGRAGRRFTLLVRFRMPDKPIHHAPFDEVFAAVRDAKDMGRRHEAWQELSDRGAAILPELLRELGNPDDERRCATLPFLERLGPQARAALPAVISGLRAATAESTCDWGGALAAVAPREYEHELARSVAEKDEVVCRRLVRSLSVDPENEVPATLVGALKLEGCRGNAARAVLFAADPRLAPRLVEAFESPARGGREEIMEALAYLTSKVRGAQEVPPWVHPLVPVFARALDDEKASIRLDAAMALEEIGPTAAPAVPALIRALRDRQDDVRWRAILALTAIGLGAREAGPELLHLRAALETSTAPAKEVAVMRSGLDQAIAATRAGKDEARLALEDEVRAAVVAHVVGEAAGHGMTSRFTITVLGDRKPRGLMAALGRRGIKTLDGPVTLALRAVAWRAGDLAEVEVETSSAGGLDSSATTYVVALVDGRWEVVGTRGGWISEETRSRGSCRTSAA